MPTDRWGGPTWKFIHTIIGKINEDHFHDVFPELFLQITTICSHLPCPECAQHATEFLRKIEIKKISNKTELVQVFYTMHNTVNKRLDKPMFNSKNMGYYETLNVVDTYNNFAQNYHTRGNMSMLAESFHRTRTLKELRVWLMKHIQFFN